MTNNRKAALASVCALAMLAGGCGMGSGAREERHMATGQRYMEKKDYARAVLEFRNATKAAPNSAEAHYQLGLALLAAGDFRSGVQNLMKCTELNPKHAEAQAKLAQLMATSRNPEVLEEARKRARAAFDADPDAVAALDAMATVEWNREQPEISERHLERALERVPGHYKSAVMLANIKLATKDFAGAEEVLRKAVEGAPEAMELRVALGSLYRHLKRNSDAEEQFQQALRLKPDYAPALLALAQMRVLADRKPEAEEIYRRIAALPDKAYRPAYALFLLYLVDANRGIAELERLYREDPQDRDIRGRLVSAYLAHKRLPDAEKVLAEAIARNAKDVPALLQRGRLLAATRRYQEAEQDLMKVLQYDATMAEAHLYLAEIHAARNEPLRQRQELAEALRLDPGSMTIRLMLATEHLRTAAPQAALEVLNQAPEYQRGSLDYIKVRNWALLATGDLSEAAKGIAAGMALREDAELIVQSANLRFRQRDAAGARSLLENLLKKQPDNIRALQALMEVYSGTGQRAAGIQKLKSYVAQKPTSAAMQMLLAGWLRRAGDLAGAQAAARAAMAAEPSALAPILTSAELDLAAGRQDSARRTLNTLTPEQQAKPDAQILFADLEQQAGNYSKCIEHLRAVVAASPRSVIALNNLAYLLVDFANKPDEGLQYAQRVKELAPNDEKVEDTIGWAFYAKGLYPTAVLHLERAVAKDGKAAAPRYHLAMAYQKAGNADKAREALAAAARLDPSARERARAAELILSSTATRK